MDDFDVAIRDLRHMARGNGPIMRIADRLEEAYGDGRIEGPRDRNRRYVKVGDTVRVDGETFVVSSIDYGYHPTVHDGVAWALWDDTAELYELSTKCEVVDSVEDVLRKFRAESGDVDELVKSYAKRLRLAGDADDGR